MVYIKLAKILNYCRCRSNIFFRERIVRNYKRRLNNKEDKCFSLICNNCTGAVILHEFGVAFNSPFVNLWIPPNHYLYLLSHLKELLNADIKDVTSDNHSSYPVGLLGGKVILNFQHYKTFDEATEAWKRRASRVNFDNIKIIFVERDGTTLNDLKLFDSLPYKHKIVLTHDIQPSVKCSFHIKGCTTDDQLGMIMDFTGWFGRKYYDQYNWFDFLFK